MNWFGIYTNGYRHRWYILFVIFADMACIGTQVAAVAVLTIARLPVRCTGLTPISSKLFFFLVFFSPGSELNSRTKIYQDRPHDIENTPEPGYDTIGFGQPGERGELDGYCHAAQVSWAVSLLLM